MTAPIEEYIVNRVQNLENLLEERDMLIADMTKEIDKLKEFVDFIRDHCEVNKRTTEIPYLSVRYYGKEFEKDNYVWNFLEIGDEF